VHVRRVFAWWLTLWFALSLAAPQLVHPCPEHSPARRHLADEHAAHHGGHSAGSEEGAPQPGDGAECCCPGPQCVSGAAVPIDPPVVAQEVIAAPALPAPEGAALGALERPAFSLPYSTPPPASVA
jgi:hypothetical protein